MYNETATQNQATQTVAVNVTYPKAKKLVNLKEAPNYQTE